MPKLRDGSETLDPRCTWIPFFDPRSIAYKIEDLFSKDKKLVSRTWRCNEVLNQGLEGACTGFAVAHELIAQPVAVENIDAKFAKERIYWEAQKIDFWPGGSYPGAKPRKEGSSVLAAMKIVAKMGYITEYRWAFGVNDVKRALAEIGPVVLGVPWYEGMMDPAACGALHPTGKKIGGHAILARGLDVENERILLHNSWGEGWGDDGTAWIYWKDLAKLLCGLNGEACVPIVRNMTPTPG